MSADLIDLDDDEQVEYFDQADAVLAAVLPALPELLIRRAIVNPSEFVVRTHELESYPAWAARAVVVALQGLAATASSRQEPDHA